MTGFTGRVRAVIIARCGGYCEICGLERPEEIHHRRARGMGGSKRPDTDWAANGLAVCSKCHALVESNRNRDADRRNGFRLEQNDIPCRVPVLRHGAEWVLLDDDGGVNPTEPKETA